MNRMKGNSKLSQYFIDKYVEKINLKDFPNEIRDNRRLLNRVLKRENLGIDSSGNTVLYNPTVQGNINYETNDTDEPEEIIETKLSNFFVVPTHRLYIKNGDTIQEDGIGVKIYTQISKKKYKCIYLNLNNEMIEKGFWINSSYLDHDLYLYNKSFQQYLKMATKLSTRILSKSDFKIFDGEWWLENRFADVKISDFEGYSDSRHTRALAHPSITNRSLKPFHDDLDSEEPLKETDRVIKKDIFHFLKALLELISEQDLLQFGTIPENSEENAGWEDEQKYYLPYKKTWEWIANWLQASKYPISVKQKELDIFLYEEKIIEIEVEKGRGRKRADCNVTLYPKHKERVFKISKARITEYINTYPNF
ncbi:MULTISPECIES: hypothetical protein [Bacillus cereus group]|nr:MULTISPECIES: hypothetical protein [Bacillus cereus group]MDA1689590.1 hypothetical protein [Bacillus cereus group sp. TH147LC]MDK7445228.1 hypothetical protein [Bacillus paranthracis]MDX5895869.1 hypothetical protein [Bacillus cereus group sp. BfR-BA-00707]